MSELDARRSRAAGAGRLRVRVGRREVYGLCDQALVSGVNFLTIVLVARAVSPGEFGGFVLAFTVLQSAGTLQAALITRPHNVLGAVKQGREYRDYSRTAALAQVGFSGVLALAVALAGGIASATGISSARLLLALAPALVAWQLQELGRRFLYTERRLGAAFANDVVSYGCQAAALVVLWRLDALTGVTALLTLAGTFALGALVLVLQLGPTLSGAVDRLALRAHWEFGKWLGVAEVGQWFSTQFYIYLAGAILGSLASGALKAGQTLLGPMSVFLAFVTSYLPIVLARERERGGTVAATTRRSLAAILPVVLAYCLAVGVFSRPLLELVYGRAYGRYADVVELFALYYVLLAFSTVAVAVLSARGMTRAIFVGHAGSAVLSLAIGWLLLQRHGPAGGVVSMLLSWTVAMALFARALRDPGRAPAGRARYL